MSSKTSSLAQAEAFLDNLRRWVSEGKIVFTKSQTKAEFTAKEGTTRFVLLMPGKTVAVASLRVFKEGRPPILLQSSGGSLALRMSALRDAINAHHDEVLVPVVLAEVSAYYKEEK